MIPAYHRATLTRRIKRRKRENH